MWMWSFRTRLDVVILKQSHYYGNACLQSHGVVSRDVDGNEFGKLIVDANNTFLS